MKERVQLYSSFYIGCKSWKADLDEFVRLEDHEYSPVLSDYGKIRKPTAKSHFLKCLYQENGPSGEKVSLKYERPEVDATAVDGPAMVQMNAPKKMKKFGEYSKVEIGDKVHSLLACVQQLDINVYEKGSRKRETREGRGKKDRVRLSIKENAPTCGKFATVLKLDNNKTELCTLIADILSGLSRNQQNVPLMT